MIRPGAYSSRPHRSHQKVHAIRVLRDWMDPARTITYCSISPNGHEPQANGCPEGPGIRGGNGPLRVNTS